MTKVEELINPITEWWDEELIRDVFWPEDVEIILATPVHVNLEDVVAWHYHCKGTFSVRSAYRVQRDHERRTSRRGAPSSSGGSGSNGVQWKLLWKIGCPGKIRHFLWRFAHNSLALRKNLERRGMDLDTRCVMCSRQSEDGAHLFFFKCKYVQRVWETVAGRGLPRRDVCWKGVNQQKR